MKQEAKPGKNESGSSLISRLAASTALMAVTVVLLALFFFQAMHGDIFKSSFQNPLKEWSEMIAERIGNDQDVAREVARSHQIGVIVTMRDGYFAYGPNGEVADPQQLLNKPVGLRRIDVIGGHGRRYSFLLEKQRFASNQLRLLLGLIMFLLISIGLIYAIQLSLLRPLKWLRSGVEAVSRGDFSTRVPVVRNDEIGNVAKAFNQMTRQVELMMDDRERLLADVSHELRSPLARIKVALELIPHDDKRDSISADIRTMESLTTALLEREQVRARASHGDTENVNLVAVTAEVIDGFRDTTPGVELNVSPEKLEFIGDSAMIKVLIKNLVDNAVKFSLPDSAPVKVSLRKSSDQIQIIIDDDGPGIPTDQTEKVFEPFVKLNPARGHRAGYGLGLNLCHRIVQAQGGTIEIHQRDKRGTRVLVNLPL